MCVRVCVNVMHTAGTNDCCDESARGAHTSTKYANKFNFTRD